MWAVATVPPKTEMRVLHKFREMDIDAFVPMGTRLTRPKRKHKPVTTTFKIFPGYIFVDLPSDFNFLLMLKLKVKFITYKDREGSIHICPIPPAVVAKIRDTDAVETSSADLFEDYSKKELRPSFNKNQLVCWKEKGAYQLGFVSRNTQGQHFVSIKLSEGNELKLPVDRLSLL